MSILSDSEIRQLCEQPTLVYKTGIRGHSPFQTQWGPEQTWYDTIKGFDRYCANVKRDGSEIMILMGSPKITDFKPMISPFVPNQVREAEFNGTPEECALYDVSKSRVQFAEQLGVESAGCVRYDPLLGLQIRKKIISYGLSSMGYDVRCSNQWKIFTNINSTVIDPMKMSDDCYVDFEGDVCIIPPNSYVLSHTIETFNMPRDVVAICVGKSTYARAGCAINVTPIEPGFEGEVVIEISNQTPLPMKVYANMGIAQFMFMRGSPCKTSYADRKGKYQGQTGITTARV